MLHVVRHLEELMPKQLQSVANSYFSCAINRGYRNFPILVHSSSGKPAHQSFDHFDGF